MAKDAGTRPNLPGKTITFELLQVATSAEYTTALGALTAVLSAVGLPFFTWACLWGCARLPPTTSRPGLEPSSHYLAT